jgi:hypothetical protein
MDNDWAFGEVPKRLKGLPWKGSRSLIAARGFKSLLLRFLEKEYKKVLDKGQVDMLILISCREKDSENTLRSD